MAKQVIKQDGSKVPFDAKKIIRSITKAAQDAKLSPDEINKIVNEVSNSAIEFADKKDKVLSSEIKEEILSELDFIAPSVSASWRNFLFTKRK